MKRIETVPVYVESVNGHDTLDVPKEKLKEEVETQLVNGKWVTLEHGDGSSELLTKKDIPIVLDEASPLSDKLDEDEDPEEYDEAEDEEGDAKDKEFLDAFKKDTSKSKTKTTTKPTTTVREEWEAKFEDVKSATATHKSKGG